MQINITNPHLTAYVPDTNVETAASRAKTNTNAQNAAVTTSHIRPAATDADTRAKTAMRNAFAAKFGKLAGNADEFHAFTKRVFGDNYDRSKAESLRTKALAGDYSWLPKVEFQSRATLQGANGAYAKSKDTIYVADDLKSNPTLAGQTFIEEAGHAIDARINTKDAVGDEGEMFRRVLNGEKLSQAQIDEIRSENDHHTITVNGEKVETEFFFNKIKKAFKKVTKGVSNVFKKVTSGVGKAVKSVAKGVGSVVKSVASTVSNVAKKVISVPQKIFGAVKNVIGGIANFAKGALGGIGNLFKGVLSLPKSLLGNVFNLAKGIFGNIANLPKSLLGGVLGVAKSIFGTITSLPKTFLGRALNVAKNVFTHLASFPRTVLNHVKGLAGKFFGKAFGFARNLIGGNFGLGNLFGKAFGFAQRFLNPVSALTRSIGAVSNVIGWGAGAAQNLLGGVANLFGGFVR